MKIELKAHNKSPSSPAKMSNQNQEKQYKIKSYYTVKDTLMTEKWLVE